ncbi:hypothetical protein ENH_00047290 [Eimeria necatrix]|uniref:Uncharacterized protein n=1 Tax=Eimeria necatrix TaxID=51315 RepID=U6N2C4_9EIME|nr:hypothetical protein ENH_00047290 [Eimeria necatrix]CDJ68065.1 hypothetical protein ENH_00047290 [Eimeria necatrix]
MGAVQSQHLKDSNARLLWGACAVAAAAAVFYFTSSSSSSSSSSSTDCSDEQLIQLLRTITQEFHKVFAEAAQMTSNLLSSLNAKGRGRGGPQALRETVTLAL